jgi:hypothetical protein
MPGMTIRPDRGAKTVTFEAHSGGIDAATMARTICVLHGWDEKELCARVALYLGFNGVEIPGWNEEWVRERFKNSESPTSLAQYSVSGLVDNCFAGEGFTRDSSSNAEETSGHNREEKGSVRAARAPDCDKIEPVSSGPEIHEVLNGLEIEVRKPEEFIVIKDQTGKLCELCTALGDLTRLGITPDPVTKTVTFECRWMLLNSRFLADILCSLYHWADKWVSDVTRFFESKGVDCHHFPRKESCGVATTEEVDEILNGFEVEIEDPQRCIVVADQTGELMELWKRGLMNNYDGWPATQTPGPGAKSVRISDYRIGLDPSRLADRFCRTYGWGESMHGHVTQFFKYKGVGVEDSSKIDAVLNGLEIEVKNAKVCVVKDQTGRLVELAAHNRDCRWAEHTELMKIVPDASANTLTFDDWFTRLMPDCLAYYICVIYGWSNVRWGSYVTQFFESKGVEDRKKYAFNRLRREDLPVADSKANRVQVVLNGLEIEVREPMVCVVMKDKSGKMCEHWQRNSTDSVQKRYLKVTYDAEAKTLTFEHCMKLLSPLNLGRRFCVLCDWDPNVWTPEVASFFESKGVGAQRKNAMHACLKA